MSSEIFFFWGGEFFNRFDVFGRCDLVFELFKNRPRFFLGPEQGDTFVPNLVQVGRAAAEKIWREKKKKKKRKPREKHNITEIFKNCIFAKTEI